MFKSFFAGSLVKLKSFSLAKIFPLIVSGTVALDEWQRKKTITFDRGGGLTALNNFSEKWSQAISNGWNAISDLVSGNDSSAKILKFYLNWNDYLRTSSMGIIRLSGWIKNVILGALFLLTRVLSWVMLGTLHIFSVTGDWMLDSSNPLSYLFKGMLALSSVFVIWYVLKFGFGLINNEKGYKPSTMVKTLMHTTVFLLMLPMFFSTIGHLTDLGGQASLNYGTQALTGQKDSKKGLTESVNDFANLPIAQNTTDMAMIARQGFKYKPYQDGKYKNRPINNIAVMGRPDFADIMDADMIKILNGKVNQENDTKNNGIGDVFKYRLQSLPDDNDKNEPGQDAESQLGYTLDNFDVKEGFTHTFDPVYPRYVTHSLTAIVEYLLIDAGLIFLAFRFAFSFTSMIATIFGALFTSRRDLRTTSDLKKAYGSVMNAAYSTFLSIALFFLFFILITRLPPELNKFITNVSDLGSGGQAIARGLDFIIVGVAALVMIAQGANAFDKATGQESGLGSSAVGALATGGVLGAVGGGLMRAGAGGVKGGINGAKGLFDKMAGSDGSSDGSKSGDGSGLADAASQQAGGIGKNFGSDMSDLEGKTGSEDSTDGEGLLNTGEETNSTGDTDAAGDSSMGEVAGEALDGQSEGGSPESGMSNEGGVDLGGNEDTSGNEGLSNESDGSIGAANEGVDSGPEMDSSRNEGADMSDLSGENTKNTPRLNNDIKPTDQANYSNSGINQPNNRDLSNQINSLKQEQIRSQEITKKVGNKQRRATKVNRFLGLHNELNRNSYGEDQPLDD